ncbi:MAG TPA: 6-phosphogluconolactonase [Candidatus Nitrosopolaris sp.]|nr:6-phosphogluconolactonase [Candidatus Nitrosopolaris sp.]
MKFIKDASPQEAASYLADAINSELTGGQSVLWLVSGGSSVPVAVETIKLIPKTRWAGLCVGLVDERFGPPGHKDSNWQQLLTAGLPAVDLNILPILSGKDIDQTTAEYAAALQDRLAKANYKVGLFGIGADGHTAGILPLSVAIDSQQLVTDYITPEFQRITVTAKTIALLDLVVAYAVGAEKSEALQNLSRDLSVREQPAQALKLAKQLVIFNDQVGDKL